jgi:hypothetical protein
METSKLLELFRRETDDVSTPYLWEDEDFFTYLNDAQDTFVRRIGGISDGSSAITKINFKINDTLIKYDERILRIKAAKDDQNRKVTVRNIDNFEDACYLNDDYGNMVNAGLDDGRTGPVRYIITDIEEDKIRLYPLPSAAGYLRLYVSRRPLDTIEDEDSRLEISSQHHLALLDWVKHKAYLKQDVETFDQGKSDDHRLLFEVYAEEVKMQKSGREDRKRLVSYGGIPMS